MRNRTIDLSWNPNPNGSRTPTLSPTKTFRMEPGKWLVDSISRRDYPSVQGGIVLIASIVMLVNLGVDLLYGLINPRIRHAR